MSYYKDMFWFFQPT